MTLQIEDPRTSPKVPPHNIEAEESVLGAALLSSDAAGTALEHLHADDFYKPVHQLIFEAISVLFDTSQPIDAITVSDQLQRVDQLERIGGADYLTTLLDAVPTTSNIGYYVEIVEEHALRRRLQRAGGKVTDFAFETDSPIADVLDQAEQTVFQVAERRMGEGLTPIDPLLGATLERAEEMSDRGSGITGVAPDCELYFFPLTSVEEGPRQLSAWASALTGFVCWWVTVHMITRTTGTWAVSTMCRSISPLPSTWERPSPMSGLPG